MKCLVLLGACLAVVWAQTNEVVDGIPEVGLVNGDELDNSIATVSPEASSEESYLTQDVSGNQEFPNTEQVKPQLIAAGEITAPEGAEPVDEQTAIEPGNSIAEEPSALVVKEATISEESSSSEELESENALSDTPANNIASSQLATSTSPTITTQAPLIIRPVASSLPSLPNLQSRFLQPASAPRLVQDSPLLKIISPLVTSSSPAPTVSVKILPSDDSSAPTPFGSRRQDNYITNEKDRNAKTLRYDNYVNVDNTYKYLYETDNGIYGQAEGYLGNFGDDLYGNIVTGGFSWGYPDGYRVTIRYRADENGYHPEGDAIPTPPPIPPLILKALRYLKQTYPDIDIE